MITLDNVVTKLNDLIKNAIKYQLATSGPFFIGNIGDKTSFKNTDLIEYDVQFISSQRLDFDGGIIVNFAIVGKLGKAMIELFNSNSIVCNIYNLESTDGEFDLEEFEISTFEDCERIQIDINVIESQKKLLEFNNAIDEHINSDKISSLNTFVALKF